MLIDQVGGELGQPAVILRTRAARLSGYRMRATYIGSCQDIVTHFRAGSAEEAANIALTQSTASSCLSEVSRLLDEIASRESAIASRIESDREYTYDDLVELDALRTLANAGGRAGSSDDSARVGRLVLQHLEDDAHQYGRSTELWIVRLMVKLLGQETAPPLPHLVARINSLIDFRGSLATDTAADWYSRMLMAHLMVGTDALSANEAAHLFGNPSTDDSLPIQADWTYAFVGLRIRSSTDVRLPRKVLEGSPGVLAQALYASDAESCSDAPTPTSYRTIGAPWQLVSLTPWQRFEYVLALSLTQHCTANLAGLLADVTAQLRFPDTVPDPDQPGSLSLYLLDTEAACLVHGNITLDEQVVNILNSYIRDVSTGPVVRNFDVQDVYSAVRLLSMHHRGSCAEGWWEGLG